MSALSDPDSDAPPLQVLLIDGDGVVAEQVGGMLQALDTIADRSAVQVRRLSTLEEGLGALQGAALPDLVLTCLDLPDTQGLETLERIREVAAEVPVVVLTDVEDDDVVPTAIRAGAQDFLVKGEVDEELLARSLCYALVRAEYKDA